MPRTDSDFAVRLFTESETDGSTVDAYPPTLVFDADQKQTRWPLGETRSTATPPLCARYASARAPPTIVTRIEPPGVVPDALLRRVQVAGRSRTSPTGNSGDCALDSAPKIDESEIATMARPAAAVDETRRKSRRV